MKIKEIIGFIGAILLIPFWGFVILVAIIIGWFNHMTANETVSWLLFSPIEPSYEEY